MARRYGGLSMSELVEDLPVDVAEDLTRLEEDWYDAVSPRRPVPTMTTDDALSELHIIVDGIDRDEMEVDGWWETSSGADFGSGVLARLEAFIVRLTKED